MRVNEIAPGVFEKRLSPRQLSEQEAVTRLHGEAMLLRALQGRVTPTLLAAGDDERGPWLQTTQVPFLTLAARLEAATAPLATAWIERAVRSAFAALAEIHEAADVEGPLHVVHADISPGNVAIDDVGDRAVFLDFELAAYRGSLPRDGAFRGTVAYASPEVARGETPTVQSDVFSLAATLLHAVTGRPPREGTLLAAVLASAAEVPLASPAGMADVLAALAPRGPGHAALVACVAHDPAFRPASARAVLLALP